EQTVEALVVGLVPLIADLIARPGGVGDRIPVLGSVRGRLRVGDVVGTSGGVGRHRAVVGGPVDAEERHAEDDLGGRNRRGVLLHRGETAVLAARERRGGGGRGLQVQLVVHDEEGVDGGRQGGEVVEAARITRRRG